MRLIDPFGPRYAWPAYGAAPTLTRDQHQSRPKGSITVGHQKPRELVELPEVRTEATRDESGWLTFLGLGTVAVGLAGWAAPAALRAAGLGVVAAAPGVTVAAGAAATAVGVASRRPKIPAAGRAVGTRVVLLSGAQRTGVEGARSAVAGLAEQASMEARLLTAPELALFAADAIRWGPMTPDYTEELYAIRRAGEDSPELRERVMEIAAEGAAYGLGVEHRIGTSDWDVQPAAVERTALAAATCIAWWLLPETAPRAHDARAWSADVLRWADRLSKRPPCDLRFGANECTAGSTDYSVDEMFELLEKPSCIEQRQANDRRMADAVNDWARRRNVSIPSVPIGRWAAELPSRGTEADQLDLVTSLAPVMIEIAVSKITVWYCEVPSPYDQMGGGDIFGFVVGAIIGAAALSGAAAALGAAVGGAIGGAAAGAAAGASAGGAGAVSTAVAGATGAVTAAVDAAVAAITAAAAALGIPPAALGALATAAAGAAAAAIGGAVGGD